MRWVLIVVGVLAAIVLLAFVVGSMLPATHSASRSVRISRPAADVWAAITDFAGAPAWRDGLQKVELLPPLDGRTVFRETSGFGPLTLIVDSSEPPRRLVTRILDTDQGFGGTWTYVLVDDAGSTRVTITENGEISSPLFRVMARYVFGYEGTLDGYLVSLGRRFGDQVSPAPAGG